MKRIRRLTLGMLFTLLMTVPFAAQAASTCTWWGYCFTYTITAIAPSGGLESN